MLLPPTESTQDMSHKQPVDLLIGLDCPWSASWRRSIMGPLVPCSSPTNQSHHVQHVDNPDVIHSLNQLEHQKPLTDNLNEDLGTSDSDNDLYHSLVTPTQILGKWHCLNQSDWCSCLQVTDQCGEEYTPIILTDQQYLDIEALWAISHQPAPTSTLHSEPFYWQGRTLHQVIPEVYQDFFNVFSWEEAKKCLLILSLNMNSPWEWPDPPHSHIYPLSGTELSLL